MNIGPRIKQARKNVGWSLQNLADRVECSKTYIFQLEKEEGHKISLDLTLLLADAFCMTIQEFIYASSLPSKSLIAAQDLRRSVEQELVNSCPTTSGEK